MVQKTASIPHGTDTCSFDVTYTIFLFKIVFTIYGYCLET